MKYFHGKLCKLLETFDDILIIVKYFSVVFIVLVMCNVCYTRPGIFDSFPCFISESLFDDCDCHRCPLRFDEICAINEKLYKMGLIDETNASDFANEECLKSYECHQKQSKTQAHCADDCLSSSSI